MMFRSNLTKGGPRQAHYAAQGATWVVLAHETAEGETQQVKTFNAVDEMSFSGQVWLRMRTRMTYQQEVWVHAV